MFSLLLVLVPDLLDLVDICTPVGPASLALLLNSTGDCESEETGLFALFELLQ